MKLRALRVHGFKSFADATDINFHEGITAIVGPNGCGKSNISDAIRWVLGEQKPTAIRGSKMEEAIFQGSVNRRPVNRGSVTMVVSNEDGSLPVPFAEVEIGRRVYRDGGSDYSINRSVVRLKDVVDLVRDTGLGANAYSVIENKMIDAILSDRAEERRSLFEEASGIGKYKDRRKAASRSLERTEMDVERLQDVIAEVETKVRSLARQKGRAERYIELRARRLAVEVSVVSNQLVTLKDRLAKIEHDLSGGTETEEAMLARVAEAEARYESLRIEEVEAEKARGETAAALETVRAELIRWERELAVALERSTNAERRLEQIAVDREDTRSRAAVHQAEVEALGEDGRAMHAQLEEARTEAGLAAMRSGEVRARLQEARATMDALESKERELARRAAQLEGDAEAASAQAQELSRRLEKLTADVDAASEALSELESQGDLFSSRLELLGRTMESASVAVSVASERLATSRKALDSTREREMQTQERAAELSARCSALESMEREQEGLEPAVRAALAENIPGVHGVLADFLEVPPDLSAAVERYLGTLARGVVVRDRAVARDLRAWFEKTWQGGGGLILLPLDALQGEPESGSLLKRVKTRGAGAPWVRFLLAAVDLVEGEATLGNDVSGRILLDSSGVSRDPNGLVRIGNPSGATGILERRERLRLLKTDAETATEAARGAREERDAAQSEARAAEAAIEAARAALREAEDAHRRGSAEVREQVDRKDRMDRHREDLSRQVEGTRAARAKALERARVAKQDRSSLDAEEQKVRDGRQEARAVLESVQEEWESARNEEGRLGVQVARLEGDLTRLEERLAAAEAGSAAALARGEALDREEQRLRVDLEAARAVRVEGEQATAGLFERRSQGERALYERDRVLDDLRSAARDAERKAREARTAERDAADLRHRLELERQEVIGRQERIRERLEGEWGKPLETLLADAVPLPQEGEDGWLDAETLEAELKELVIAIEKILPVNMLAVEEHEEESQRLAFLRAQYGDLIEARDNLRSAIRRINQTATELFTENFAKIRENFRQVHMRLFEGGEADIWLADESDPLESPVEIHASPRGKKTQRIDLLSGGERALTALSLLFSIYLVKPSPFCVLDEVDAPLDENNIGRFIRLLNEFKTDTQFVVITHNPRTIEAADWIYGVTMEEPGVSTIVGVRLEQALQQASGTPTVTA